MANISKEDDLKDFEERSKNGWKRKSGWSFQEQKQREEEDLRRLELEVKQGLAKLRRMRRG